MKSSMKGAKKAMGKNTMAYELAKKCETKRRDIIKFLDALADLAFKETKNNGKFTIPRICMMKARHKPARKAGKRIAFGKEIKVTPKAAHTIVKCYAVKALKQHV